MFFLIIRGSQKSQFCFSKWLSNWTFYVRMCTTIRFSCHTRPISITCPRQPLHFYPARLTSSLSLSFSSVSCWSSTLWTSLSEHGKNKILQLGQMGLWFSTFCAKSPVESKFWFCCPGQNYLLYFFKVLSIHEMKIVTIHEPRGAGWGGGGLKGKPPPKILPPQVGKFFSTFWVNFEKKWQNFDVFV